MLVLHDIYLAGVQAERVQAIRGSGTAAINLGFGEPILIDGNLSMLSGITVELQREDGELIATIESEYVAVFRREQGGAWGGDWASEVSERDLARASLGHAYSRHREQVMEITMRMGIPIFRLAPEVPELSDEDWSKSEAGETAILA